MPWSVFPYMSTNQVSWYGTQATVNVAAIVIHIRVTLRDACC